MSCEKDSKDLVVEVLDAIRERGRILERHPDGVLDNLIELGKATQEHFSQVLFEWQIREKKTLFENQLLFLKSTNHVKGEDEQRLHNLEYAYAKAVTQKYCAEEAAHILKENIHYLICHYENVFGYPTVETAVKKSYELQETLFNSDENPWFVGQVISVTTGISISQKV